MKTAADLPAVPLPRDLSSVPLPRDLSAVPLDKLEPTQADVDRAGRELKQSALGLAQAWQALAKAGWSSAQLRPLLLALRQVSKGCDRLRLAGLKRRVMTLETQLIPFVSDFSDLPHADQARAIEANVSALTSSILALDFSQALPALLIAKPANEVPPEVVVVAKVAPPAVLAAPAPRSARMSEADTVFVLRADNDIAAGLIDALKERGHRIVEVSNTHGLELQLAQVLPGVVIADARFLNGISRQLGAMKARANSAEVDAAVVVISDRRDLGRRLLATRHGALGYFEEPIDVLEISNLLGLRAPKVALEPAHRALICTSNFEFAEDCARWLLHANVASRIESNAIGTLAACLEYLPEMLLVDASLRTSDALRLVSELRRHSRHVQLPIVLFAGANSLTAREAAVAAGADEYLLEPVRQRHLLSVVTSRLQRLQVMKQNGVLPKQHSGLMSRAEFLSEYSRQSDFALLFVRVDQLERMNSSYPIGAFDALDAGLAALIRPRLKNKELFAYFQDGQYLLGVKFQSELQMDDLAEKIRRSVELARIDLGQGLEKVSLSIVFGKTNALISSAVDKFGLDVLPRQNKNDSQLRQIESLLHRCRHLAADLSAAGGNRTRASAVEELHNPARPETRQDLPTQLLLQPLLCAMGRLQGQYLAVFSWLRDGSETNHYAEVLAGARAAGAAKDFDRRLLLMALNSRATELKRGRQIRVLMEIGEESIRDSEFTSWLTQQLNALNLSGSGLSLFVATDVAAQYAKAWQTKRAQFHAMGLRSGVKVSHLTNASAAELAATQFDFVLLPPRAVVQVEQSEDGTVATNDSVALWSGLLKRTRERGAMSIVPEVANRGALDQLKSLRVDFVLSEVLGPAHAHADFDFVGFLRA